MINQIGPKRKGLSANVAAVWLLSRMRPNVISQGILSGETLLAVGTLEGSLTTVLPHVHVQLALKPEFLITDLTAVRFLLSVLLLMIPEAGGTPEAGSACVAHKRLFGRVDEHMRFDNSVANEPPPAYRAGEWFLACVLHVMPSQVSGVVC